MTDKEAMKMALEFIERVNKEGWILDDFEPQMYQAIAALKERLAQEKALQALHSENERLGLYKDAYAEQEPVAWGVFEGNLHDMFFTQEEAQEMASLKGSHAEVRPLYTAPPQRTEQEPYAYTYLGIKNDGSQHGPHLCWKPEYMDVMSHSKGAIAVPLYIDPPQRTEQEQQIETLKRCLFQMQEAAKDLVEQAKSLTPPQRTWVDLSDEDIEECFTVTPDLYLKRHIAQRISAKLKEKNSAN